MIGQVTYDAPAGDPQVRIAELEAQVHQMSAAMADSERQADETWTLSFWLAITSAVTLIIYLLADTGVPAKLLVLALLVGIALRLAQRAGGRWIRRRPRA